MKVAYKHLINHIPSKPSIDDISNKFFQLGHEHEIHEGIFYMELTPNRGDCFSINGLLRDLAVFYDIELSSEIYRGVIKPYIFNFINKAPKACPLISFLKIDIEKDIKPYEGLLEDYFNDLNINKNNFFTDISNYISYETGQPTHCYDATKINKAISLEMIEGDYQFEPIVGKKIELIGENLAFIEGNNVINLAGIMGGIETSCSSDTKSVIVECAYFNPEVIIGKSIRYDINSDSAHKFERGVDPLSHEKVLRRFIKIVENHANIKNIEILTKDYQEFSIDPISFNEKQLNKILGTSINKNEIEGYLLKLGFNIIDNKIFPPSYRADIKTANDIAEEIARVVGYNNIQSSPLEIYRMEDDREDSKLLEQNIQNHLIEHGFFEVINSPFEKNQAANSIKVDNPLDSNREYVRTELENSLIDNLLYNEKRQHDSVKLFEISDVYFLSNEIKKKKILGVICSGRVGKNYIDFSKKIDKNYLINLFQSISSDIEINPKLIARENLDSKSKNQIVYLEIELDDLKGYGIENKCRASKKLSNDSFIKYQPISNFPSSARDLSFSIKDKESYNELQEYILNYKNDLIKDIFIFDFFNNKKNNEIKLGIRIIFQSKLTTITEEQINNIIKIIIANSISINGVSIPGLE
ncbi:phenylalanine--tRNA ligase subunit beta [Gammaproteobacteria bacterium]|nr:phenylalanine--tRNA ligase subunit beta [Gammaproteobacteria bacterium]